MKKLYSINCNKYVIFKAQKDHTFLVKHYLFLLIVIIVTVMWEKYLIEILKTLD